MVSDPLDSSCHVVDSGSKASPSQLLVIEVEQEQPAFRTNLMHMLDPPKKGQSKSRYEIAPHC